jgi:pilus assembly protein CpaE
MDRSGLRAERGQASVELVAAVPFALLVGLVAWQLVLVGHALSMCANAARVAARAEAVGRDPRAAARSALPAGMEAGLRVVRRKGGGVHVSVRAPRVLAATGVAPRLGASASLGGKR